MIEILALSGSLRAESGNTALLRAAALLVPAGVHVRIEAGIGELPHFNPDLEGKEPESVLAFRARLAAADAVIVSSPEYAHGIPGSLKNALDWTVGSGEFSGKPVALFNASPRASLAQESLAEIVRTMDARLVETAFVSLPLLGSKLNGEQIAADEKLGPPVRRALAALLRELESRQA